MLNYYNSNKHIPSNAQFSKTTAPSVGKYTGGHITFFQPQITVLPSIILTLSLSNKNNQNNYFNILFNNKIAYFLYQNNKAILKKHKQVINKIAVSHTNFSLMVFSYLKSPATRMESAYQLAHSFTIRTKYTYSFFTLYISFYKYTQAILFYKPTVLLLFRQFKKNFKFYKKLKKIKKNRKKLLNITNKLLVLKIKNL